MLRLLHVEDNDDDAFLVTLALDQEAPGWREEVSYARVSAYEEALERVKVHRPHVLLLDLSLGDGSGYELLVELKRSAETSRIPVVILSNSDDPTDVSACYAAHAAAYLVKPAEFPALRQLVGALRAFWLGVVRFPP